MRGDDDADPNSQRIGIGNPTFCAFDYGDAPNTYGTLLARWRPPRSRHPQPLARRQPAGRRRRTASRAAARRRPTTLTRHRRRRRRGRRRLGLPGLPEQRHLHGVGDARRTALRARPAPSWSATSTGTATATSPTPNERSATDDVPAGNADPTAFAVTWSSGAGQLRRHDLDLRPLPHLDRHGSGRCRPPAWRRTARSRTIRSPPARCR